MSGNLLAAVLALVVVSFTARALGVAPYGELVMIYVFVQVIERVISFQSWQPVIKYGAPLWGDGTERSRSDLPALLKFGFLMDLGSAACGFLCATLLVLLGSLIFDWSEERVRLILLYSTVLLFNVPGVPTAILRLAGRFRLMAYSQLVSLVVRVLLCMWGLWQEQGLVYFLMVWGGTQVLGSAVLVGLALRELHSHHIHIRQVLAAPLQDWKKLFPGIWGFAWSTNMSLTLRLSSNRLDTLIVGALADPSSASLYHIAKQIGRVGEQLGTQIQAVLYPDVARLWARGETARFKRIVVQLQVAIFLLCSVGCLLLVPIIEPLIRVSVGPDFVAAAPMALLQMAAVVLILGGATTRVALLAMGRPNDVLRSVLLGTVAFHVTAFALIPHFGAIGGNVAHVVLAAVWVAGLTISLFRAFRSSSSEGKTITPGATAPAEL